MKRYSTFIMVLVCAYASAQNINDVLRYSAENIQGTARFQGLSGAFGALGGDLSALNVNPAGSAVFNNSLFSISATNYNEKNDATYFGSTNGTNSNTLDVNQAGGVFVFKTTNGSPWKKFSLAFNYDLAQNFDTGFYASGNSTQGIDSYFLSYANGVPFGPLLVQDGEFLEDAYLDIGSKLGFVDQQAFLGYYGGIIDPVDETDDNNTQYTSNALYNSVNQQFSQSTNGYNNKFTFNMATEYRDCLYLGASLNFHNIHYEKYTQLTESGYDAASEIQLTTFDNLLQTEGSGFSITLGAIAKLNNNIRIGGSYQSPTWYRLSDNTSQRINSDLADSDINFINFNVINVYDDYTIKTPGKLTGSLALIFGKNGLLSFDYGYQDMSKAELRPTNDPTFSAENTTIANTLRAVSSFRLGGEYRIDRISLRGGYRFEQSPYEDGVTIGDLNGYSGGLGYNFGASRLDLAVNRAQQDVNQQLYNTGVTTPAFIHRINTNVTLGYTLNF